MANPLGSAPGIMVGVGVGTAAAAALEPLIEPGAQAAWVAHPNRVLDPGLYARLVAQGAITIDIGRPLAQRSGFNEDQFNRLVHLAQSAPDLADALELWRRKKISEEQVEHALAKAQIEVQYWDGLKELFNARLSPQVAALAIVRGIMKDPGFLPVGPPLVEGKVKAFPVSPLDPLYEAQGWGYDRERLFVETAINGRPMGPEAAAASVFRDILERVDYDRAIAEGDVRNEWADAIFEHARQIPSVADYVNANIRGWIDTAAMHDGVARHGMSPADADLLYKRTGRPATTHQVHIGWARGGRNPDAGADERAVFEKAIKESDIRPEWADLLWSQRYTYPPFFAIRSLMQAGLYDQPRWEEILIEIGWPPQFAHDVSVHFTAQTTATTENPYTVKAQTQLWNATHKGYTKGKTTQSDAESALSLLITDPVERAQVFLYWDEELALSKASPPPPA